MSAILNPVPSPQPSPKLAPVPVPEKPKRPRWVWWAALALILATGVGIWTAVSRRGEQTQTAILSPIRTVKVTQANLDSTIRVSGQTSARDFVNIIAPRLVGPESNRPLILLKLVQSGKMVKKGEVIVEIDGQSLLDHIDDVHSTVVQAESDVKKRQAEQEIESENLRQNVRLAKAEFDKLKVDARASEVRTAIDQELIKLAVEEADAAYKELVEETKLKKVSQESELKILGLTRERHTRHRDRHKRDVQRFTIRSPMDGLVVVQSLFRGGEFIPIGEGDQVFPGQLVAKVVNPRSMQVEGMVNQAEIGNFRIGQTATIALDAFPGLTFRGKVYSMGAIAVSGMRQQAYIRNIPIRIMVQDYDPRLIPDLSAGADVLISRTENAAIIPLGAVRKENGKDVAYVRAGDTFVPREVRLGERNEIQAAVLSGLSAGDEVALNYEVASAK